MRRLRRIGSPRLAQRGNALVFALLGLLVSALGAAGVIQGNRLQARQAAGNGEATILEKLRDATNDAIFDGLGPIRNGLEFRRNGVTIGTTDVKPLDGAIDVARVNTQCTSAANVAIDFVFGRT